jgi:hypothetical protein
MQCSLEVLHALEPDAALKATIHQRMIHVRDLAAKRFTSVLAQIAKKSPEDMRMLGPTGARFPSGRTKKATRTRSGDRFAKSGTSRVKRANPRSFCSWSIHRRSPPNSKPRCKNSSAASITRTTPVAASFTTSRPIGRPADTISFHENTLIALLLFIICRSPLIRCRQPRRPASRTNSSPPRQFDKPESFATEKQPGTEGWRGGIGTWSIKDGAAYAVQEGPSEKRPNGHEAVCEHIVDLGDLVLTGEFKLGPSPQIGFVCRDTNKPNHHQGRVVITPTAIWIQKMSGISKETRREELKKIEVKLDPNTWHRITVEVCGDHFFAKIDDTYWKPPRTLQRAQRPRRLRRESGRAQFRNIALWSAKPNGALGSLI